VPAVVVVVVAPVTVCVIIFHGLNFLVVMAVGVLGFATSLELFVMAWVAVNSSSSIVDCVVAVVVVVEFCVFPVLCEVWVFFCWCHLGEFVGILCFSATMLGMFFVVLVACQVNLAWAFLFTWPCWFQWLAKG